MRLHPFTNNYEELRNAVSGRNGLPEEKSSRNHSYHYHDLISRVT